MTQRESAASAGDGQVTLHIADAVAHVLFDRPWARNAMTWAMYDGLGAACAAINENSRVRVAVLRGAGGKVLLSPAPILRSSASSPTGMTALPTKQGSTAMSIRWSACAYRASQSWKASRSGPASPSQVPATSVSPP
jgi:hypothetical protein